MESRYDVVVVGGGIAGPALATALARRGHSVLVLEKTTVYPDRVRGEWIAPWGVVEVQRLGLYDALIAAGGHHLGRHVTLGEDIDDPHAAIASATNLTGLVPGVPGPLCIRHPVACEVLARAAAQAGATVLRGVAQVHLTLAGTPAVSFLHEGQSHTARCRLVVGADGRTGITRAQAGIPLHHDEPHHLFSGLLVDGAEGWPDDLQTKGTEGDFNFLVFPQGNGRVRLYLGYGYAQKDFLAGDGARDRFLQAFHLASVPNSEVLANATPISDCHSYPNEDTWTDEPFANGLVLVGDAAGHNDPIIGQGLAITFRDVRIVTEAMLGSANWGPEIFGDYAAERAERMRRLRFAGHIQSVLDAEFGTECAERRRNIRRRSESDPALLLPLAATMVGPEALPAELFTDAHWDRIFAPA
jgi:menaquinone-9 beta-reductase